MRFDLRPPAGTCYLAEQETGAFVEVFQELVDTAIPAREIRARRLSTLNVPFEITLADCTDPRALRFGVTAEIHSTPLRNPTQQWADALQAAGFGGIRYRVRHDPSQRHGAVAIFGSAGLATWPNAPAVEIDSALIAQVEATFNVRVL
jgi:hypothetical protein